MKGFGFCQDSFFQEERIYSEQSQQVIFSAQIDEGHRNLASISSMPYLSCTNEKIGSDQSLQDFNFEECNPKYYILIIGTVAMTEMIPIKLVVIGDANGGKTCLLTSFIENTFPTADVSAVMDVYQKCTVVDNHQVRLGLWDTSGRPEYDRLRPIAYPYCDVFLIAFSIVDTISFMNARKKWYPEILMNIGNVPIIFLGTKTDLRDEYAVMKKRPGQGPLMKELAQKILQQEFKCKYFECSAKLLQGFQTIFEEAMRMALKKKSNPIVKRKKNKSCSLI